MRSEFTRYGCVSIMLLLFPLSRQDTKTNGQTCAEVKIIQMTAKRYEFAPSQLHVKAGSKVGLKITALDREHAFRSRRSRKVPNPMLNQASFSAYCRAMMPGN
jgi:hypothetical protein